ncbi:putative Protein-glutamine gamma-glutamyltransferase [Rhodovastum atsumiense]|uniref:DUF3488 domain-containing protein n=1 Tax=Rhodovastum atsumiense TaxID=504468 RepID=A0A5M6IWQ6_9PROT|nr:DUF3488 and transglutaminase-like domain-containing protein [Rhodovastum atsumiense]KAA5612764.1 DUF3488 domain-containing protein [Rhodovastum atsumiense]CAH2602672.1 putative Protein-glutamine gamma-glutamyltransferase [Rhodovastum atsumiense]
MTLPTTAIPVRGREALWLAAALAICALPGLLTLPWWVAAMTLAGAGCRWLPTGRPVATAARLGLLLAGAGGIAAGFPSLVSGEAVQSFLTLAIVLKWTETRSSRDALLVMAASVVLCASGLASWNDGRGMLLALAGAGTVMLALLALQGGRPGQMLRLALPALPVAAILFLAFPRIPGPLWNLGLAMGMPIGLAPAAEEPGLGFQETLEQATGPAPTGPSGGNEMVLVARFDDLIPPRGSLYWRGPVFTDFDGLRWSLSPGWNQRSHLVTSGIRSAAAIARMLRHSENRVSYSLRLVPHGGHWLYALDLPLTIVSESVLTPDLQLVSMRRVEREERYALHAALDYAMQTPLEAPARQRALHLPEGANPRLVALGQALRTSAGGDRAILHLARRWLAEQGFQRDEQAPRVQGFHALDTLMFETRRGGGQPLAEAFTVLMRAAGVPARLVTGYRGGTPLALTSILMVRRSHAHAWTEVWLEDAGWVRADAIDMIGLPVPSAPRAGGSAAPAMPRQDQAAQMQPPSRAEHPATPAADPAESWPALLAWLPAVLRWLESLGNWVVHYDPARQVNLFERTGFTRVDATLLVVVAATGAALASLPALVLGWKPRRRDPLVEAYAPFLAACARLGYPRGAAECPAAHARRVAEACPGIASWAQDISARYLAGRYGPELPVPARRQAIAALRRQIARFRHLSAGIGHRQDSPP